MKTANYEFMNRYGFLKENKTKKKLAIAEKRTAHFVMIMNHSFVFEIIKIVELSPVNIVNNSKYCE